MVAFPRKRRCAIAGISAGLAVTLGSLAAGAAAAAATGGPVVRIGAGQTLSAIATRFHTTVAQLAAANGVSNPNLVVAGTVLQLPIGDAQAVQTPAPQATIRIA